MIRTGTFRKRLTAGSVARHSFAATLLIVAPYFLNRWDLYQHPQDAWVFFALLLGALCIAGARRLLRALRDLSAVRIIVFSAMAFLAFPWGEWVSSDALAHEDWTHQLYVQALWVYGGLLFFHLFPGVAAFIRRQFGRLVRSLSRRSEYFLLLPPLFFALTSYVALSVYHSVPFVMDSRSYLFQANIFSHGKLFAPMPPVPDFFSLSGDYVVMHEGRWFSMYQPGYPAFLAFLMPFRAEWLLSPLLGALTLALWIAYAKRWHGKTTAVILGLLLFFSPFLIVMSGAVMSHPLELFLASGIVYLCRRETEESAAWRSWTLCAALVAGIPVRGFSLLAFTGPVLAYVSWNHFRSRRFLTPAMIFAGIVLGMALVGYYQWKTTGSPTVPGYNLEQKEPVRYGFQETWKGLAHTPYRGLENVSNNWLAINTWLTGFAGGCFLFLFAVLFLEQRFQNWDRVMFISTLSIILFYYFYFFQDLVYGPRFWYVLVPFLLLLIARMVDSGSSDHPLKTSLIALMVVFFLAMLPDRLWEFVRKYDPSRYQAAALLQEIKKAGTEKTLVFLDPRISQSLVNLNDPFLKSPVVLCRDLQERNMEAIRAFPDYRVMFFRPVDSSEKGSTQSTFQFLPEPDRNPPGYFSFYELAMTLESAQYYPDKDLFDIVSNDLFMMRTARDQWKFVEAQAKEERNDRGARRDFRLGLIHAARMLLLPRLAFLDGRTSWRDVMEYDRFRSEQAAAREHLQLSGEVGKPILQQIEKLNMRIDRNEDGVLENSEIARFLATKVKYLL